MVQKTPIKIIKRMERERATEEVTPRARKKAVPRDSARDAASTVTGWVREFQHRRRAPSLLVEK
jgi:hypothetical protein